MRNIKFYSLIVTFLILLVLPVSVQAHIDLLSPKPLLGGVEGGSALKVAPFGAPNVDVNAAEAVVVKSGSEIELEVSVFIYHPGEIVVLYTQDPEGDDIEPVYEIPSLDSPIPHNNLLARVETPCVSAPCRSGRGDASKFKISVQLPDVEGEIILVVRQVMFDKFDELPDGTVSLRRIYYHQAAKLNLVP